MKHLRDPYIFTANIEILMLDYKSG